MQWLLLAGWSGLILAMPRRAGAAVTVGLVCAMGTQIALLALDRLLSWQAVVPLHLCSLFGVLLVWGLRRPPAWLMEGVCFLGAPGAFLTLFFPAAAACSHPLLMKLAFFQLHVLVALAPLYWHAMGKPLPADPRRTLIGGSGYVLFISLFNRLTGANYLFLSAAPAGTPLAWLFERGSTLYLCALVMLCILIFSGLKAVYLRK